MSLIKVDKTTDFPIQQQSRKCTDLCCTAIGVSFTFLLIVLALIISNYDHQIKTSFPSDSKGRVCGFNLEQFPFVYFTNYPKIDDRVCVSQCPKKGDTALKCVPTENIGCLFNSNPQFRVSFYENQPQTTPIGSFCVPIDHNLKQQLYQDINVSSRFTFFKHLNTILISCLIALGVSIIFMLLMQRMPRKMTKYTLGFGCFIIFFMIIFTLFYPSHYLLARILFALVLLALLATIYLSWKKDSGSLNLYRQFIRHSTEMIDQNKWLTLFIPIFLGSLVLFILILTFQLRSLYSSAPIYFDQSKVYYQFKSSSTTIWTILVAIQAIWGFAFLKQAFNFCISGNTVEWYFKRADQDSPLTSMLLPLKSLIFKHFGSVIAGSFMTGWFALPDYIFDAIRSDEPYPEESQSSCQACLNTVDDFFDLVRSDSMGYIYLTGNPYCNSSRYCEYLCDKSPLTRNSQSISRAYRICAHFLIAGIVAIVSFFLQGANTSVFVVLVVFLMSLFIGTFFISLHADAAESVQIIFMMDEYFATQQLSPEIQKQFNDEVIKRMKLKKDFASQISKLYNQSQI